MNSRRGKGFFPAVHGLSARGKASQELGEAGEAMARVLLARQGVKRIERIHTGWKVLFGPPDPKTGKRTIKDAFPIEKVSGDFIGMKDGKKVHVEAKATEDDRIIFSRLEPHQVMALDETVELGGISMLFVMIQGHGFLLNWPIEGFRSGAAIVLKENKQLVVRS